MHSPAFRFYPADFVSSTVDMRPSEVGAYIRLLCHQWERGYVPSESSKLSKVAGCPVSSELLTRFPAGDDGFRRNQRLETERSKQREYSRLRSEDGKRGGGNPNFKKGSRNPYYGAQKDKGGLSSGDKGVDKLSSSSSLTFSKETDKKDRDNAPLRSASKGAPTFECVKAILVKARGLTNLTDYAAQRFLNRNKGKWSEVVDMASFAIGHYDSIVEKRGYFNHEEDEVHLTTPPDDEPYEYQEQEPDESQQ